MSKTSPSQTSGSRRADPGHAGRDLAEAPEPEPGSPTPGDASAAGQLQISVILETDDVSPPLDGWLDAKLSDAARAAGVSTGRLAVAVVDDAAMAEAHEAFSGVPGTTDVLTFDLRDAPDASDTTLDGDILVCLDEARRQASKRGHDCRIEALLYAVHGMLHLLGEDDHATDAYERMHRREDELLTAIGVGAVFAKGPD